MKRLTLLCLLIITFLSANSQNQPRTFTIKGTTIDSTTRKAVGFATIMLSDSASTNIKAVPSESDGKFSMTHNKAGEYTVECHFMGYQTKRVPVKLDGERTIDLGEIEMNEGVQIGAATVIGQLVTTDIDKTTYNTSADPETVVMNGLEMMRKVPMLSLDGEENIQLKGQGNFKILVNGKSNSMMSRDYKQVLKSMPASSIKSIEVITNPPAKYEAEGIDGIINIITHRKTNDSYNGSLGIRGDQFGGLGGNGYIATSIGKFNLSLNLFLGEYLSPGSESTTVRENYFNDELRYGSSALSSDMSKSRNFGAWMEASYEIDTFNLITLAFSPFLGNYDNTGNSWSEYRNTRNEVTMRYDQLTTSKRSYGGISGNIDYQRIFMKPDRTFTVSYKMDYNPNSSSYNTVLDGVVNYESYKRYSNNKSWGAEHTLQIDYYEPITKEHIFEVGGKYIMRPNVSNSEIFTNDVPDNRYKNDLDYLQHIAAAYTSYQYKLKKFSAKAGLRAEYTINTGTFKLREEYPMFNRYFNLIPYVNLSYKPTDEQNFRFGYTQRLQRPSIWYMNPYIDDQNPMYISTGNPNIESAIGHSFDLNWGIYKRAFNLSASSSVLLTDNSIQRVSTLLDNGAIFSTYENIGRSINFSALNGYGSVRFFDGKLSINGNFGINYTRIEQKIVNGMSNQGWTYRISGGINGQPWKNGNIGFYGGYNSGNVGLQNINSGYSYTNFSIGQSLLKRNLTISAYISSPFRERMYHDYEQFGEGFYQKSENWNVERRVGISVQWRFGKMMQSVKKARRGISNDDGGGAASGGSGAGGGK
ncbi:putative TonB-dependent receptor [Mucinivorans hirudinis]|uniref:Putative TonB-dependent receptor n=1 Tax=Mucinivorans hirudinis TaxID=1433126 RepID=A0A060RD90_9BACT|nr:putative TonB-dependent receptor [Mucinivorans hirudinis]